MGLALEIVVVSSGVAGSGGIRAEGSTADGSTVGAGTSSMPALSTVSTPASSLSSEDLGHTVCVVAAIDWST